MKKLLIIISLFAIFNIFSDEELYQKIQFEYQITLESNNSSNSYEIPVNENFNPTLYGIINNLAKEMDIKSKFKIAIFKGNDKSKKFTELVGSDMCYNAEASGFTENSMCLSIGQGLFTILTYDEFIAVIYHELAHIKFMHPKKKFIDFMIKNIAINFSAPAIGLILKKLEVGTIKRVALGLIYSLTLVPYCGLKFMAKARKFEFEADAEASKYIKNKQDLINAVEKVEVGQSEIYKKSKLAKLFNKFSTHPLLQDRADYIGV